MPRIVDEIRENRDWAEKKGNPVPVILAAIFAFAVGMLGMTGMLKLPSFTATGLTAMKTSAPASPSAQPAAELAVAMPAKIEPVSSSRAGRADAAPLLRTCVSMSRLGFGAGGSGGSKVRMTPSGKKRSDTDSMQPSFEPADIYRMLHAGSTITSLAAVAGVRADGAVDELALLWADVVDCIYRQNSYHLCDPDNRAFAVEAASHFIRQFASETARRPDPAPQPGMAKTFRQVRDEIDDAHGPRNNRAGAMNRATGVKDRVLSSIRMRVGEGRLSASDFGMFAPAEIKRAIAAAPAQTVNACATKS